LGANAGFVNFWREPIFACDCTAVRGKSDVETLIILEFLRMHQNYLYQQARGSAQPHVYPKDIESLRICIPPIQLIEKFGEHVIAGNQKIESNLSENKQFTKLRDWLLPMLMNGQVKVEASDHADIEAAA
jgi:type I restriction enzyme S subunit